MKCEYCEKNFKTSSSFNHHQKTAKYCLIIRGVVKEEENCIIIEDYTCKYCDKNLSTKGNLDRHLDICNIKFDKI